MLEEQGYPSSSLYALQGGNDDWKQAGFPVESRTREEPAA